MNHDLNETSKNLTKKHQDPKMGNDVMVEKGKKGEHQPTLRMEDEERWINPPFNKPSQKNQIWSKTDMIKECFRCHGKGGRFLRPRTTGKIEWVKCDLCHGTKTILYPCN